MTCPGTVYAVVAVYVGGRKGQIDDEIVSLMDINNININMDQTLAHEGGDIMTRFYQDRYLWTQPFWDRSPVLGTNYYGGP